MPNRLINESSPYLLQHANNPVDWYAWGDEALQKAKDENKLILVSIGYAACHWCHVMEHESFEDNEVAELMNKHFVCIKVDREERPDIDKIYMDAVMLMTKRGGWPLNAFALPDGRPVYGGTYFPKDHWMGVLNQLSELYAKTPEKAIDYAYHLKEAMINFDQVVKDANAPDVSKLDVRQMKIVLLDNQDLEWGGRNVQANKFPLPVNNLWMLRSSQLLGDEKLEEALDVSLEKMALGGIYDQLGGGFARYSVDAYWKVPHFEKMLYDNGQLVSAYAEAHLQKPNPLYERVVRQTIDFVERELMSEEGGFYSSLDADSEGVEGKFYVWDYNELGMILGDDLNHFANYYNISPKGNWEGNNILFALEDEGEFAMRWHLDPIAFAEQMERCRRLLFAEREKRVRPGLDDKILASWNGLMLKGLVDAYRVFGDKKFLALAERNASFLVDKLATEEGQLYRSYKEGKRTINAFLDDYANLIEALIALYEVSFEEKWLDQLILHLEYVRKYFFDDESGMFFYSSSEDPILVRRKIETQDDVIPSSNATLAMSLYQLSLLLHRSDYRELSEQMMRNMKASMLENPSWHAKWGQLALMQVFPHYEVAITGPEAKEFRLGLELPYFPNKLFAGAESSSKVPLLQDRFTDETTIFVCQNNTCQLPVKSVSEARKLLQS
ncbi:MAG: thioredoxin domain-containing protein [Bacteroidota bacterium]